MLSFLIYLLLFLISSKCEEEKELNKSIKEELEYTRYAWSFYDREMPYVIQKIFDYTYNNIKNKWNYIYLTYENLSLYLNTSSFPSHFKRMLPAHQSDYIRLLLIAKYGGWWIDTAIIINDEEILEELYEEGKEKRAELVGLCNLQCPRKLIETSFFYAPKGSIIMKEWSKEFVLAEEIGEANYMYNIYRNGVNPPQISYANKYPIIDPYLVVFATQQQVFDRNMPRNTSLVIHPAKESIFKLNNNCKNNAVCVNKTLHDKRKIKEYRIIKMNSWLRRYLFPKGKTVTAYDSFYEPHPVKKGMKGINIIIREWIPYLFLYLINIYWLSLIIRRKVFKYNNTSLHGRVL